MQNLSEKSKGSNFCFLNYSFKCCRRQSSYAIEHLGGWNSTACGGWKQWTNLHPSNLHPYQTRAQTLVVREPA